VTRIGCLSIPRMATTHRRVVPATSRVLLDLPKVFSGTMMGHSPPAPPVASPLEDIVETNRKEKQRAHCLPRNREAGSFKISI